MSQVEREGGCCTSKRSHIRSSNHDLKVMLQWFKRNGDKYTPKNKEDLLLCYRETYTCVVQGIYPYDNVASAVAESASASHSAHSQANCKTFDVAASGFQATTYVAPTVSHTVITIITTGVDIFIESALDGVAIAIKSDLAHGATSAIDSALAHGATSNLHPNNPSTASPLDWGEEDPFDVGVQLTMNAPFCGVQSKDESSDDDSIFVDFSRD
jgi:hypothetical protein